MCMHLLVVSTRAKIHGREGSDPSHSTDPRVAQAHLQHRSGRSPDREANSGWNGPVDWEEEHPHTGHVCEQDSNSHGPNLPPSEPQHEPRRCIRANPSGRRHNNPRNYSLKQTGK